MALLLMGRRGGLASPSTQKVDRKSVLKSLGLVTGRWGHYYHKKFVFYEVVMLCPKYSELWTFRTLENRTSNFINYFGDWFFCPLLWPKSRITKLRTFLILIFFFQNRTTNQGEPPKNPNFELLNIVRLITKIYYEWYLIRLHACVYYACSA